MTDLHLFAPPPADGNLTNRQRTVLALLEQNPDGITRSDAGRELHTDCRWCERARRRQHSPGAMCEYAPDDGRDVLEALVKRGLARRRRRGGLYQPVKPGTDPATNPFPDGF